MKNLPASLSMNEIIEGFPNLFIDAYGVLIDEQGARDGAVELVNYLNTKNHDYFIVTNGATTDPKGHSEQYARFGLKVPASRVVSSGYLLIEFLKEQGRQSLATFATGPASAKSFLKSLGLKLLDEKEISQARQFIIMDEPDDRFLELAESVMNAIAQAYEKGEKLSLILANPDIIYPAAKQYFRFTAGGFALLVEQGLALRFGEQRLVFEKLGKPSARIFAAAKAKCLDPQLPTLMIGDQLQTDIAGANQFGIDSALILGGVVSMKHSSPTSIQPTYLLQNLHLRPA